MSDEAKSFSLNDPLPVPHYYENRWIHPKEEWPAGPWDSEPDDLTWIDEVTDLDCMIHRGPAGGLCGYVGVPQGHPWYGKEWDEVDARVHGGLTYSAPCREGSTICHVPAEGRPHDIWWLGFDCAHSGDVCPALWASGRKLREHGGMGDASVADELYGPNDKLGWQRTYKNLEYVKREVENLATQAKAAARRADAIDEHTRLWADEIKGTDDA